MEPARVAIVYQTAEGHTARVADRMAATLRAAGLEVDVRTVGTAPASLAPNRGVIVGGSVHVGKHDRRLVDYLRQHCDELNALPTLFFSVSLAAAERTERGDAEAMQAVERLLQATGFRPGRVALIGGNLAYTRYNVLVRWMMKRIARQHGSETDTSRDWDHTDWAMVDEYARDFAASLQTSTATAG